MTNIDRLQIDNSEVGRRRFRLKLVLAAILVISALRLGSYIAHGDYTIPLLITLGVFALGLLSREPIIGFYLSLVILIIVPYSTLRIPFPLLHSPLSIMVVLTLAFAIMHQVLTRKPLTPSNLYGPMFVWCSLLLVFAIIGHGPAASTRAAWSLGGLWPFFLVLLLVDTPRKARNVLLAFIIPLLIVALAWLPTLLSGGGLSRATGIDYSAGTVRSLLTANAPRGGAAILLTYVGGASWQAFSIMAMAWCVLFSIAVFGKKRIRWLAGFAAVLLLFPILLSTFGNAMLIVALGAAFVLLFGARRLTINRIGLVLVLLGLLGGLLFFTAGGQNAWQRVVSGKDPSIQGRKIAWKEGAEAFLSNPIIGWGAYNEEHKTQAGNWLLGHSGFLVSAYEFGLVYIAAIGLLFFTIAVDLFRLAKKRLSSTDRAIVIGIQALFATYIVQFFLSGSLGIISIDIVFWLFMGLACVWLNWLQSGDEARLVE